MCRFIFNVSKDNVQFKLQTVNFCRHTASLKILSGVLADVFFAKSFTKIVWRDAATKYIKWQN